MRLYPLAWDRFSRDFDFENLKRNVIIIIMAASQHAIIIIIIIIPTCLYA